MANNIRWRWVAIALIPGLLSDLIFVILLLLSLNPGHPSEAFGALARSTLYALLYFPFVMPVYLYFVGRGYVRDVHAGLKSAIPFALMYSVANLVLWACGAALVGSQMHMPG
jgi:hypothetical protein